MDWSVILGAVIALVGAFSAQWIALPLEQRRRARQRSDEALQRIHAKLAEDLRELTFAWDDIPPTWDAYMSDQHYVKTFPPLDADTDLIVDNETRSELQFTLGAIRYSSLILRRIEEDGRPSEGAFREDMLKHGIAVASESLRRRTPRRLERSARIDTFRALYREARDQLES